MIGCIHQAWEWKVNTKQGNNHIQGWNIICIANKLKLCSISKGPASQPLLCGATSAIYSFIIRSFIDLTWSLDRFNFTLPNRSIFSFLIITLFYWTIFIIFHFHLWTEGVLLCCALFSKVVFALLYLLNIKPSAIVLCLCLYLLFYCVRVCFFLFFFLLMVSSVCQFNPDFLLKASIVSTLKTMSMCLFLFLQSCAFLRSYFFLLISYFSFDFPSHRSIHLLLCFALACCICCIVLHCFNTIHSFSINSNKIQLIVRNV